MALKLLRSLWLGRHDAALIALRAEKDFWKDITKPLLASKDPVRGYQEVGKEDGWKSQEM